MINWTAVVVWIGGLTLSLACCLLAIWISINWWSGCETWDAEQGKKCMTLSEFVRLADE